MEKQVIKVQRKTLPYRCFKCNTIVTVDKAEPKVIETDRVIIHTFDYGHRHDQTLEMHGNKLFVTEHV